MLSTTMMLMTIHSRWSVWRRIGVQNTTVAISKRSERRADEHAFGGRGAGVACSQR